jgi:hypothetical protein
MGSNGSFIISWIDWNNPDNDNLYAQMYNSLGEPIGNNLLINDVQGSVYRFSDPTLSMIENGNIFISWQDNSNGNYDIYCQVYSLSGQSIRTNFKINSNNDMSDQKNPIIYLTDKGLYAVWEDNRVPGQGWDIFANVIALEDIPPLEAEIYFDIPLDFLLKQNHPNPFNLSTTISFSIPERSFVSLKIFDLLGNEIAVMVSEELSEGNYTRQWDAKNLSSGVYFYRLQTGVFTETKKLILLK